MIDLFLEKIKLNKGKGLNGVILINVFLYTEDYNEVKYIVNQLNRYCEKISITISIKIYDSELKFTENYDDAREIFKHFYNIKLNTNSEKLNHVSRYGYLIETTDTIEEVTEIFEEMKNNNVKPAIGCYVELMKKQPNYERAREIFEKYILIPESRRIETWKTEGTSDGLKRVYGILYLKAQTNSELIQIKNELKDIHMSTEIEDYYYLKEKSCILRIRGFKKKCYEDYNDNKVILKYIFENEDKNNLKFSSKYTSGTKVKRISNIYQRNKKIVEHVKNIYNNTCQICGEKLELENGYYSEVHHLHPLHLNGPDIMENMIVLCPNHHVLFDRGIINIDLEGNIVRYINGKEEKIKVMEHKILNECAKFNNENVFKKVGNKSTNRINIYNKVTYGSKVIIMVMDTKEEFGISIPNLKDELSYFEFKLLNHKIEDNINIDNRNYFILDIK